MRRNEAANTGIKKTRDSVTPESTALVIARFEEADAAHPEWTATAVKKALRTLHGRLNGAKGQEERERYVIDLPGVECK